MAYRKKSTFQSFESDWQTTAGWAQSQGISPNDYLPVYQLELTRMQNGSYPLGRAERNLAVLAAHNPNAVTPLPSDNPSPTSVFSNAVSDVGKIATGLIGVFTGSFERQVWDSAKATVKGIIDPASLESQSLGGTIGNWLNDTLLSYLPGAADIGTILQHDPHLSGSAGISALMQHPLLSALDLFPGYGGAIERVAGRLGYTGMAAAFAKSGGASTTTELARKLGGLTIGGKPGVTVRGTAKTALTLQDRLELMAARTPGIGPALSSLNESWQTASALSANQYTWLMGSFGDNLKKLVETNPEEANVVQKALDGKDVSGGDTVLKLMRDPSLSPLAKEVVRQSLEIGRFVADEDVVKHGLSGMYDNSGKPGLWATTGRHYAKISGALGDMNRARRSAMARVTAFEPIGERLNMLDKALPHLTQKFSGEVQVARRRLFDDPKFQSFLTAGSKKARRSLSKVDQLRAVLDEGGFADDFMREVGQRRNPADVEVLADAMIHRLERWGVKSIDATDPEAPAELTQLYTTAKAFKKWAQAYKKTQDHLDSEIFGELEARKAFRGQQLAYDEARIRTLKDKHALERDTLKSTHDRARGQRMGEYASRVVGWRDSVVSLIAAIQETTDRTAAGHMTRAQAKAIVTEERVRITALNQDLAARIRASRQRVLQENKAERLRYERDRARMSRRHYDEMRALKKDVADIRIGSNSMIEEMARYGKAIEAFHQAVYDHPADVYRDPFVQLLKRRLMALEDTAAVKVATEMHLTGGDLTAAQRKSIDAIRNDSSYLAEYTMAHWREIMLQPDLDPELREQAEDAMHEYRHDSMEELKLLISQGFKVPYIPAATSADVNLGLHSVGPRFGHGIPKPDIAKERLWDLTPRKEDFAVGLNKAAIQTLMRDSSLYLIEHVLKPMSMTEEDVGQFINRNLSPATRDELGNHPDRLSEIARRDLNLKSVDFRSLFSVSLPRYGSGQVYLPAAIVDALEKMRGQQDKAIARLIGGANKVFRYSILGLSPRYDAHIVFGGTMMLALRSSSNVVDPALIKEAWRAMRDRTLPIGLSHPAEEGFESPAGLLERIKPEQAVLDKWNHHAGRDMGNMMIGEHIEQVQRVSRYAAKPLHAIRAVAELNFRFTRHVRALQYSIAYFDGLAKYEKTHGGRIEIEDPETGRMIHVSSERAQKEALHHVQEVYGNLNRMSPFERQVAQSVMPFYGWQKHVLGYVMSYPFDHPMRALILSQLAYNASNQVPLSWPIRMQLLFFLGAPDKQGNVNAIDIRSLDPFRDVSNYMTWTGVFESLNPALTAPLAMAFGSQAVYGESSLYPNVTYNAFYGIQTASAGGNIVTALEQWTPQLGAIQSAIKSATGVRSEWQTNRGAAIKTMLESLNIPFVNPPINVKQVQAKTEMARFETAYKASQAAFSSGDFSGIQGFKTVPNPLNPAYQITPQALEELYNNQAKAVPGVAPVESIIAPPSPYGY